MVVSVSDSGLDPLVLKPTAGRDVGFVSLQPPEGRCRGFDKYSSDTCKAAGDVRVCPHPAAARPRQGRGDLERACVWHSPKLPVNPSILQEKTGSPGWRPAGGCARTAGPPSEGFLGGVFLFVFFLPPGKKEERRANGGGSARRVRLVCERDLLSLAA